MRLNSIEIQGFRVFENFKFTFPQAPGLYLITGRNVDRPALGSNGIGKSSLFDAVNFALYGDSVRGVKGGELLRTGSPKIAVKLTTDTQVVERHWAPNRNAVVRLNGKDTDNKAIVTAIGLEAEMFTTSTLVGQLCPMFADLQPVQQVEVIQTLLGFERWVHYSEAAEEIADRASMESVGLEGRIAGLQHTLDSQDLQALQTQSDEWQRTRDIRIATAKAAVASAQAILTGVHDTSAWREELSGLQAQLLRAQHNATVLDRRLREFETSIARERGLMAGRKEARDALTADIEFYKNHSVCPTCQQPIMPVHAHACADEIERRAVALAGETAAMMQRVETLNVSIRAVKGEHDVATKRALTLQTQINATNAQITAEERRHQAATLAVEFAQRGLDAIASETNPWEATLLQAQSQREALEHSLQTFRTQFTALQSKSETYRIWQRGFKTIRSQLVSAALSQFGLEVAAVLEDLGLRGWQVVPSINPAVFESARSASGFRFEVIDPEGVQRTLKAYSGGELQRVRLAIQLGLGAVIGDVNGACMEFEVFDEPSSYLSTEGVEGLFRCLASRAERLQRPIFLVDHHFTHASAITKVFTLVRSGGVTTLEQ